MQDADPSPDRSGFSSAAYWEARYASGGTSGAGSRGQLLRFKAEFLNGIIAGNAITSVLDLGCGDGELAARLSVAMYCGVDVSRAALERCIARCADRSGFSFLPFEALADAQAADLALSIDVIFHLVEDAAFDAHVRRLFGLARRLVVIYASNCDRSWPSPHVRHRRIDHLAPRGWRLAAHLPNPYPFDPMRPDDSSFADFFVYVRGTAGCSIVIPGAT